jgi:hypothetical protein
MARREKIPMATFKYLSLALPGLLEDVDTDVKTDAPVFTSPMISARLSCCACGEPGRPLVYRVPGTTETVHRGKWCPGIYHYHAPDLDIAAKGVIDNYIAIGQSDCGFDPRSSIFLACAGGRSFTIERIGVIKDSQALFDGEFKLYQFPDNPAFLFAVPDVLPKAEWDSYEDTGIVLVLRDGIPMFTMA